MVEEIPLGLQELYMRSGRTKTMNPKSISQSHRSKFLEEHLNSIRQAWNLTVHYGSSLSQSQ